MVGNFEPGSGFRARDRDGFSPQSRPRGLRGADEVPNRTQFSQRAMSHSFRRKTMFAMTVPPLPQGRAAPATTGLCALVTVASTALGRSDAGNQRRAQAS